MKTFLHNLLDIRRYPSAIAGLIIIIALISVAVYALIALPHAEAIRLWRAGEGVWEDNPRLARPLWSNWFTRVKLPATTVMNSVGQPEMKKSQPLGEGRDILITFTFDYPYDAFPQDLILYFQAKYATKQPHVDMTWLTPDGREIRLGQFSPRSSDSFRITQDDRLKRRLGGALVEQGLFAQPDVEPLTPLEGRYTLQINAFTFEPDADVDAKFVLYGQVHGLAGTDHRRRDLMVALLWGTPIALAFGLLAALGTTVTTMFIAAFGVWFGGVVDGLIQRITEVRLILPLLPILIMVGTFYSRSIWLMLGVVIILSIFGSGIKTYRAIFLQVKESPYIEAARAYGAGNGRIIAQYLVPRIIPLLIPELVVLIPSYVFLEASLAVLGLGDPVLPTWGKIIDDANSNGALYNGYYYWVLQPAALLMLTGLGFSMVGFALDRIFNPRLRGL
jgi:peptide/nickel transport system permease protein